MFINTEGLPVMATVCNPAARLSLSEGEHTDDQIPQRLAARLVNREVMIYRERLAAAMASARKQTAVAGPRKAIRRHARSAGYSTDDGSSFNDSDDVFDQQLQSESLQSSPSSSPQFDGNNFKPKAAVSPAVKMVMDELEFFDSESDLESDFDELDDVVLCKIDAVVRVARVHDCRASRPLLHIRV